MNKKIEQIDKIYMSSGFICSKIREVIDRVDKLQDDIGPLRGQCGFDEPPHIIDPEMKHKDEIKPLRDNRDQIKNQTEEATASSCDCGRRKNCEQITTCASPRRVYFYLKGKDQDATGRPEFINIIHCPFCGGKLPG